MATRAHSTSAPAMPLAPISTNIIHVRPGGCPAGVEPRLWRKALSRRVHLHLALATALLGVMDGFDGDPDLEDNADDEPSFGVEINGICELELDTADDEPLLGSPEIAPTGYVLGKWGWHTIQGSQERWSAGFGSMEEEQVNEDGGNILDEPHGAELDLREGEADEDLELDHDAGAEDHAFDEEGRDYAIGGGSGI